MRGTDRSFEVLGIDDPVAGIGRVLSSRYGARVRAALLYALEGAGYREAAHLAGLGDHRDIHRAAWQLGLGRLHEERRRERDSARYSKRDLADIEAVLGGTATTAQLVRSYVNASKRY